MPSNRLFSLFFLFGIYNFLALFFFQRTFRSLMSYKFKIFFFTF